MIQVKKIFIFLSLFEALLGLTDLKAQVTLDFFEANEVKDQIFLKWAVSQGQTCNGITITRSSDGLFFQIIGRIEGVCGSPDVSVPYDFTDEAPLKNQTNYYKLELGVSDFSEVISINYIEKNEEGFQISPNPTIDYTTIYYSNPSYEEVQLVIIDAFGKQVEAYTSKESSIDLDVSHYSSGMYFFLLEKPSETIKGKFLKAD